MTKRPALALGVLLVATSCGLAPSAESSSSIEVDVFSGQRNPGWTLPDSDAEELRTLVEDAPARDGLPLNDGLGFRGFVMSGLNAFPDVDHGQIRIDNAGIFLESGSVVIKSYEDADSAAFTWLVEKASSQVPDSVLAEITGD